MLVCRCIVKIIINYKSKFDNGFFDDYHGHMCSQKKSQVKENLVSSCITKKSQQKLNKPRGTSVTIKSF